MWHKVTVTGSGCRGGPGCPRDPRCRGADRVLVGVMLRVGARGATEAAWGSGRYPTPRVCSALAAGVLRAHPGAPCAAHRGRADAPRAVGGGGGGPALIA